jgi:hypothetical protein
MTGVTLPASMSSRRVCRSSCRGLELSIRSRWPTNRDSATARRLRSKPPIHRPRTSLPTITSVPRGGKGPPQLGQRTVAGGVQDEVPAPRPVGDVGAGVVDDLVGTDRPDQLQLGRAGHPGDVGAERLGELHLERPHAACRPDDQDPLPRLQLADIPKPLEGGEAGDGDGRGVLEAEVGRLGSHSGSPTLPVCPKCKELAAMLWGSD